MDLLIDIFVFYKQIPFPCRTEARTFVKTLKKGGSFPQINFVKINVSTSPHPSTFVVIPGHPSAPLPFPVGIQFVDCLNFSDIKKNR